MNSINEKLDTINPILKKQIISLHRRLDDLINQKNHLTDMLEEKTTQILFNKEILSSFNWQVAWHDNHHIKLIYTLTDLNKDNAKLFQRYITVTNNLNKHARITLDVRDKIIISLVIDTNHFKQFIKEYNIQFEFMKNQTSESEQILKQLSVNS